MYFFKAGEFAPAFNTPGSCGEKGTGLTVFAHTAGIAPAAGISETFGNIMLIVHGWHLDHWLDKLQIFQNSTARQRNIDRRRLRELSGTVFRHPLKQHCFGTRRNYILLFGIGAAGNDMRIEQ